MSGLFLFDAAQNAPMSEPIPSRLHHVGFVVDNLAAATAYLRRNQDRFDSDFALLERDERWSLHCHDRIGEETFMIQLSESKGADRGQTDGDATSPRLQDHARRPYGLVVGNDPFARD